MTATNSSQLLLRTKQLLSLLTILLISPSTLTNNNHHHHAQAYTYEPPGKDPVSIDKIRNNEKAITLTSENFDELTAGKMVFLKFYAPYCPHCKDMAGAWNQLAAYYQEEAGSNTNVDATNVVIGSIDCTDSPNGKALCTRFKMVGLPTLLYGDTSFGGVYLEEYADGKDFQSLKSFAIDNLVPKCGPWNIDACSPETQSTMRDYMTMSYTALDNRIKSIEGEFKSIEDNFKNKFDELQKSYDSHVTEKEMTILRANANVKLIEEILAMTP